MNTTQDYVYEPKTVYGNIYMSVLWDIRCCIVHVRKSISVPQVLNFDISKHGKYINVPQVLNFYISKNCKYNNVWHTNLQSEGQF
jgi:hypothetical protein